MDELALPFPFEVAVPRYPPSRSNLAANAGSISTALDGTSSYADTGSLWEVPDDQHVLAPSAYQCIEPAENTIDENDGCAETGRFEPELEVVQEEDPEPDLDPISTIDEGPRSYENALYGNEHAQLVEPKLKAVVEIYNAPQSHEDVPQEDERAHCIESTNHNNYPKELSPQPIDPIKPPERPERPPKRAKKSQKKKVKRGKTTSAVVRKTVESDVEDDVIWIDEKKSTPAIIDDTDASEDILSLKDTDDIFNTGATAQNNINPVTAIAPKTEVQPPILKETAHKPDQPANPAPKKRGRKRKMTGQEDFSAKETSQNAEESMSNAAIEGEPQSALPTSPQPSIIPEQDAVKHRTPEPNVDSHSLHTDAKSPGDNAGEEPKPAKPIETPKKQVSKGPDKHSPITITTKVAYRVGLSRKARIAPLLKIVRK
ncbi:uncharacterized protein GIQ15_00354 [Arthroderma uncinatum]|uniref:uncharacterized protein n=1 Tax=Arthroderma uncinatum TaxID=74035 RepID=UPI00144AE1AA|nr:uncharacterized protein GIQ15_00354 [Arthroderma uncinatum]KAF3490837.1 hypothetical protein GIQ15_00354 [Arthroderma uncinatum]